MVLGTVSAIGTKKGIDAFRKPKPSKEQLQCEANGGRWDEANKTCILPDKPNRSIEPNQSFPKPQQTDAPNQSFPKDEVKIGIPEVIQDQETGKNTGIRFPDGRTLLGLSQDEIEFLLAKSRRETTIPEGGVPAGTAQAAAEGAALAGQIGASGQIGLDPTEGVLGGIDPAESVIVALREGIPRALTIGGGLALTGAVAGAGTPASPVLAAAGAAVGFVGSLSASLLGNMKSQRRDNTRAQQRTLDEGKQTLQDWSTLAASDPSNRLFYLDQFNNQLQLIQNSHVSMIRDTQLDVAKFDTAIPNLAEFESFYSIGGERDALIADMQRSLRGEVRDQELNFRMLEFQGRAAGSVSAQPQQDPSFLGSLVP